MAIPLSLEDLLHGHMIESTRIELKQGFNPERVVHTICAFANDIDNIGGGYIILGVAEDKDARDGARVVGIDAADIDLIMKKLEGFCHAIEPLYEPICEPRDYEGRMLIVIWCPAGFGRPYKAARNVYHDTSDKRYYVRKLASTKVASPDEERQLFYASATIPFDDQPNLLASPDDLSLALMREHLKEIGSALYAQGSGKSTIELADDLQLLAGPPEDRRPRNVGILMFSDRIQEYFRYARIEVVDMPDPTGEGMTEQVFTGPIQRQLKDALAYLRNYVVRGRTSKDADRPESRIVYNYPFAAVEEILSNAVYHRSYQVPEPIVVRITPEAMEVTSYPGFDRSISDVDIASYHIRSRMYRNRRIGDFLKELHLIEGRNTGFPTAFSALRKNGSELPTFEMDEARGYLSVVIPVNPAFARKPTRAEKGRSELERRVIEVMDDYAQPMLMSEIARALGYKGVSARLRSTVREMLARGTLKAMPDGARTRFSRQ